MSPKIRAVFFKELRDSLRDRRTVFATVVIPLVLYPVMLLLTAEVTQMAQAKLEKEIHTIAIPVGTTEFFEKKLGSLPAEEESSDNVDSRDGAKALKSMTPGPKAVKATLTYAEMSPEAADKALTAGAVRAIVEMDPEFEAKVADLKPAKLDVKFDQAEQRSNDAANRIRTIFERYRKFVVNERLTRNGLGRQTLEPFAINIKNVAQPAKVGGSVMGSFLPLLFIMMIITGAIYPAIDMTAGEKERSTLETLIGAPVRPIEIISGKFLAVATMALGNATLNVGSFAMTFTMMPLAKMGGFEFPWAALPLTLLLLLPLALFFSGLLLAVASFAANQKEAQIYCLPIYLVPVLGMMVVMMPGIELEGPLLLTPVINTALLIKQLFLSHGTAQQVAFVFFSTCLYAAGAVAFAARIFAREEVLFSAQGSLRLFLSRKFFKPAAVPKPGDALVVAALLYPINFYFQGYLQKLLLDLETGFSTAGFALSVGLPIWLLFGALPCAIAWYLKADLKKTFQWRMPAPRALLGGLLLAAGSWLIVQEMAALQSRFWEYPIDVDIVSNFLKNKSETIGGMLFLAFFIGVTPGICEEHFFRGYLQQGITRKDKWFSLITVGIIFGAFHSPFWKMPITATLGVAMAYVAYETASIWPGVIFHAVYNTMTVLMPAILTKAGVNLAGDDKTIKHTPDVPLQYLIPSIVLFIAGILLVRGTRPKAETENKSAPLPPGGGSHAQPLLANGPVMVNAPATGEHA